jgi:hypothetical protein
MAPVTTEGSITVGPFYSSSNRQRIVFFPLRRICLGLVLSTKLSLTLRAEGATSVIKLQDIISGIDGAQEHREQQLVGYTATEHYVLRNSHFDQRAELAATVVYRKGQIKTYTILWRSGPRFLQERVIDRILKEDAALSLRDDRPHTLLNSANYAMQVQGIQSLQGMQCYIVKIHPRAHRFSLIEGTAWVDVHGFSLRRIEGKPAASPSFWTGLPTIEREYTVLNGFSFPQHSRATSKGFVAGKSELDIDYSHYVILEQRRPDKESK